MLSDLPCVIHGYVFIKLIGKGGFSSVYLVQSERFQTEFCAKVMQLPQNDATDEEWKTVENEIHALTTLNHPHVIRMYDHFHDSAHFYLILEYCKGGSLQNEISKNRGLSLPRFRTVSRQILSALSYCHRMNIAHHDIKLGNILLDEYGRVKLADFGISVCTSSQGELTQSFAGSIQYEAPEILNKRPHDPFKSDMWALGVLFAHMINGVTPWRCDTMGKLKKCIMKGAYVLARNTPEEVAAVISKMIVIDPNQRLSTYQLLDLPLFQAFDCPEDSSRSEFRDCLCPTARHMMARENRLAETIGSDAIEEDEDAENASAVEKVMISPTQSKALSICGWNLINGITNLPKIKPRYHTLPRTFQES